MTSEAPELLPCPFCGAMPHLNLSKVRYDQLHGNPYQDTIIVCPHLCARMEGSRSGVIERWNIRADLHQQALEAARAEGYAQAVKEALIARPPQYAIYGADRTDAYAKGYCGGVEHYSDAIRALAQKERV